MCSFFEVSKSAYYRWQDRLNRPDPDKEVAEFLRQGFTKSNESYGYRRLALWYRRTTGKPMNYKRAYRLMRKFGFQSQIRKRFKYRKVIDRVHIYPNVLNRDFMAQRPNEKWVTDITYIHTSQGVSYLSCIKDLYDDSIVAYKMKRACDVSLVLGTLYKAFKQETLTGKLLIHSDQGFQYASHAYKQLLEIYGVTASMSRRANCLDNAKMENFFGHLKEECIRRIKLVNHREAEQVVKAYISFYNEERIQLKTKMTPLEMRSHFC
jgi:transposase InsO family protein